MDDVNPPRALDPQPETAKRLRSLALDALREALGGAARVALLEFPDHSNVGDSAIWLGQRALLSRLSVEVAYSASIRTYRADALRRRLGSSDPVLMLGGGNFGDVWPSSQAFKLQVLEDSGRHPIVFLPQTLHFLSELARDTCSDAIAKHGQVTLMARDFTSLAEAEKLPADRHLLSPDAAFGLRIRPTAPPDMSCLWLMRSDREARGPRAQADEGMVFDWAPDPCRPAPAAPRVRRAAEFRLFTGKRLAVTHLSRIAAGATATNMAFDRWANERLLAGIRLLSRGESVVTDRLHAHILCLLLGIPNIPIDNSYGKLSTFVETWGTHQPLSDLSLGWTDIARRTGPAHDDA